MEFQRSGDSWIVSVKRSEFPGATRSWPGSWSIGTIKERVPNRVTMEGPLGAVDVWPQSFYRKEPKLYEEVARQILTAPSTRQKYDAARKQAVAEEDRTGSFVVRVGSEELRVGSEERRFHENKRAEAYAEDRLKELQRAGSPVDYAEFFRTGQSRPYMALEIDRHGHVRMVSMRDMGGIDRKAPVRPPPMQPPPEPIRKRPLKPHQGTPYHVKYTHQISPSEKDVGPDVKLSDRDLENARTIGAALRDQGAPASGGVVKSYKVQDDGGRIVIFPKVPGTTTYWHAITLTRAGGGGGAVAAHHRLLGTTKVKDAVRAVLRRRSESIADVVLQTEAEAVGHTLYNLGDVREAAHSLGWTDHRNGWDLVPPPSRQAHAW